MARSGLCPLAPSFLLSRVPRRYTPTSDTLANDQYRSLGLGSFFHHSSSTISAKARWCLLIQRRSKIPSFLCILAGRSCRWWRSQPLQLLSRAKHYSLGPTRSLAKQFCLHFCRALKFVTHQKPLKGRFICLE